MDFLHAKTKAKATNRSASSDSRAARSSSSLLINPKRFPKKKSNKKPYNNTETCIEPGIKLCKMYRFRNSGYELIYGIYEKGGYRNLHIISNTPSPRPTFLRWIALHQSDLKNNTTNIEKTVSHILSNIKGISFAFQRPFLVSDKVFFANYYIYGYNVIIEIDVNCHNTITEVNGNYHNTYRQYLSDIERTAYLNSMGIRVFHLSNQEIRNNPTIVNELLEKIARK